MPALSIIIPTYREAGNISLLVHHIRQQTTPGEVEIIVADGGSDDGTANEARLAGADIVVQSTPGRAVQMNAGARLAHADVFYFLHADVYPPPDFAGKILQAVRQGAEAGCFRMRFRSSLWLLKINAFFTRFPFTFCRGGDQSLFITRRLFEQLQGFDENLQIMEDFDIVRRIQQHTRFHVLPDYVTASARKYEQNSWWRVQIANFTVMRMWAKGASQQEMITTYQRMLRYRTSPMPQSHQKTIKMNSQQEDP
ncbi:rSAM/selenodomain-associated transferase 2 [Thermoflavifilum aggregans]|uniref:RSAM/selenodomain-associated transferase 2 n=1 Tax=Thermoflavifilum aggregans TaxID=454188 RepID=A0A2M9CT75_9BACT|nr:TIGR04283 family arsenosugar biosynthesis glycosyltransferase [Thermoflavifilum aggregans]PJJ75018.1 rSAM/selenodomain-associated transferase 2 [Thermoflavifilum aggregans]